jgi:predicted ATP-grasp superfamily ATP-dependent carboligase
MDFPILIKPIKGISIHFQKTNKFIVINDQKRRLLNKLLNRIKYSKEEKTTKKTIRLAIKNNPPLISKLW